MRTLSPRPCATIVAFTEAPISKGLPTDSLSPSATISTLSSSMALPTSPGMISTFKVSPDVTRYCLPPVLMTAYINNLDYYCDFGAILREGAQNTSIYGPPEQTVFTTRGAKQTPH